MKQDFEIELHDKQEMLKFLKCKHIKSSQLKDLQKEIKALERKIKTKNWE